MKFAIFFVVIVAILVGLPDRAGAQAIITNGTVTLGVDTFGQLNIPGGTPSSETGTTVVGLRYNATGAEATAPGCLCEGWGVADGGSLVAGWANNASGSSGLSLSSFVSTPSTSTSVVTVGGLMRVTHEYLPAVETPFLYRVNVTVENLSGSPISQLLYRRVMDWDVEPTAFAEFVTIQGTAAAVNVIFASDDGFASSNPLSGTPSILFTGDAVDSGPEDHGALFDFDFGTLAAGDSFSFETFYGAAGTEAAALAALGAVGAEVYSLGQPDGGQLTGAPNTFMFGFAGVGGVALPPPVAAIPEPASVLLFGLGAAGLFAWSRSRRRKAR